MKFWVELAQALFEGFAIAWCIGCAVVILFSIFGGR